MKKVVLAYLTVLAGSAAAASPADDASRAVTNFEAVCAGGKAIWARTLCGPLLFVDPATRNAFGTRDPGLASFTSKGRLWTGTLPAGTPIANTSVELGGIRFAEVLLPLPIDPTEVRILLAHESFHRIQPELGFHGSEAENSQLDTKEGRVLVRLEASALRAALLTANWRAAARDALAFRSERLRRFSGAEAAEGNLLANEGLAEYTGIRLGAGRHAERYAIRRLDSVDARPSLVRSLGYVIGPAYGLLLDRTVKSWSADAIRGRPLPTLLAERIGGPTGHPRRSLYKESAIVADEEARERVKSMRSAKLRDEFQSGPTASFPFEAMNIDFDPNSVVSFEGRGSVYSRSTTIHDRWGELSSSGDVLISNDWDRAILPGPVDIDGAVLKGPGWSARLQPGYSVRPSARAGDVTIVRAGP